MSNISLTAAVPFKPGQKPSEIILQNVPTVGVSLPEDGLVLFYGFQDGSEEISDIMSEASKNREVTASIEVIVDINEMPQKAITPETLPATRFLNLTKITKALEEQIKHVWKNILDKTSIDQNYLPDDYWKNKNFLQVHPQLLGQLRNYADFKHIEAVAFYYDNPKYEGQSLRRRVALFSNEHVVSAVCKSYPEIEVILPSLGQKPANAPRM